MAVQEAQGEPKLKRAAGLTQITLFGLGSMLGAGIYGLIGKAAAELGVFGRVASAGDLSR